MNRSIGADSLTPSGQPSQPVTAPLAGTRPATPGPRRAIWGLVNDGYALVGKTANLSYDEAFELCRVPDIGDPSGYLDHGVAYLRVPKWGHVFARYFTNAERDSAGRASLVYDVVALSDDEFAALGNDAFRAIPPLPPDRRPEGFGELPLPTLDHRTDEARAVRRAELLASDHALPLDAVLGALLAGDRVLAIGGAVRPETIECLTLLVPPSLRPVLTFQSPTVDVPKHLPRLTVAERGHALLVERDWTAILPRDAGDPGLVDWNAVATRLVALGRNDDRLRLAWTAATGGDLGTDAGRMLRADALHEGLRLGDIRRAVLVVARADHEAERRLHVHGLLETCGAERVARALADVVRGGQRDAWPAVRAVSSAVGERREDRPEWFDRFFRTALECFRDAESGGAHAHGDGWPALDVQVRDAHAPDTHALAARVMLACAAAALGDVDRFLELAEPELPWDGAWRDGCAAWVKGHSAAARLFDALAARGATYADAIEGAQVVARSATRLNPRSRARASALALAIVRRTLRERAALEPPDRLGALLDVLMRVWAADGTDPSAALSRAMADAANPGREGELLGWVVATLERAHAGALADGIVREVAAVLETHRRLSPRSELPGQLGRVLLHLSAGDPSFMFRPSWVSVCRGVEARSRRELTARALAWLARGYASGRFTLGAFADACAMASVDGCAIDEGTAALLAPHLAAASVRGSAADLALLTATVAAVSTPTAAETLTEAMLATADESAADAVRMRRLALAVHEVEHVRDEDRYTEARTRLRRVLARGAALAIEEERALRQFLSVEDGSVLGRLVGRLTGAVPNGSSRPTHHGEASGASAPAASGSAGSAALSGDRS